MKSPAAAVNAPESSCRPALVAAIAWITQKFGVQKLRVYLACDNVVYWSKRQGLDPRYSFTGATNFSNSSPIRTISGGVTVQF